MQGPDLTWKQIIAALMNQDMDVFPDQLRNVVAENIGREKIRELGALEELGMFSDVVAERHMTPLDTLVPHLSKQLAYEKGERDIVILNHDIIAQKSSGNKEKHRVSLVAYGEPNGYSAMARTVGYTCAIVSHMVLSGN